MKIIGVIADTRGLVRREAIAALRGADLIVHAGDIGSFEVIEALQQLGPVFAVRGNVDGGLWAGRLPTTQVVEVEKTFFTYSMTSGPSTSIRSRQVFTVSLQVVPSAFPNNKARGTVPESRQCGPSSVSTSGCGS